MQEATLDARGLSCPMPIVKLSKQARGLAPGGTITVIADDPGFDPDVRAWVEAQGHELVSFTEDGGVMTAVIKIR